MRANYQALPGPDFRWLFVKSLHFKKQCREIFPLCFWTWPIFTFAEFHISVPSWTKHWLALSSPPPLFLSNYLLDLLIWSLSSSCLRSIVAWQRASTQTIKSQIFLNSDIHWVRFIEIILTFVINGSHQASKTTDTIKTFWQNSAVLTLHHYIFSGFYCCGIVSCL